MFCFPTDAMPRGHITTGVVLSAVLLIASCGANTTTTGAAEPTVATPTVRATPSPTPAPPAVAPTETPAPSARATPMSSLYTAKPGPDGWPIEAGLWTSQSFNQPLTFKLPVDGVVVSDARGRIEIAVPGRGTIHIAYPLAISSPSGPIPISLATAENALRGVTVGTTGELPSTRPESGVISWRDVHIPSSPIFEPFTLPCARDRDASCLDPLITESGLVWLELDQTHRFVTQDYDTGRLYVVASGNDADDVAFAEFADAIGVSVRPAESLSTGVTPLGSLPWNTDTIAAGSYVARVGKAVVTFEIDADVTAHPAASEADYVGLAVGDDVGWLWIMSSPRFVGADDDGTDFLGGVTVPQSIADVLAALQAQRVVLKTGRGSIGANESMWFDVTAPHDEPDSCRQYGWATPEATCVVVAETNTTSWFITSDTTNRYYYVEDIGVLVVLSPAPGRTWEEVALALSGLLDGMTVSPAVG